MTIQVHPLPAEKRRSASRSLSSVRAAPVVPTIEAQSFIQDRGNRRAIGAAIAIHAGLVTLLSLHLADPPPKPPEAGMQVSLIDLGDLPPNGDINGNTAPPRPNESQAIEADEVPVEPTDKPVVEDAEPVDEMPSEDPTPEKLIDGSPPQPSSAAFSEQIGTGTLALGAKTHGNGGGLDGDLAAAIGNAIATQIKACWDAPRVNLPDDLSIQMTVSFRRDGNIYGEPTLTRLSNEVETIVEDPGPFEIAAIEAVKRCAPIKLPPTLYAYWSAVDVQIFSSVIPEEQISKEAAA